jgi:RHS repeat-associated protein
MTFATQLSRRCRARRVLISTTALMTAALSFATPALAQEASIAAFPVRQFQDENGVDLLSGAFTALSPSLHIGGDMGLTYFREIRGGVFRDTIMWNITVSGSTYTVALGTRSEVFTLSGGVYMPVENTGSTLTFNGTDYTYTAADGTLATFRGGPTIFFGNARGIVIQTLKYPNGRTLTYYYWEDSYVNARGGTTYGRRLQGVKTNAGWQMNFEYSSNVASASTQDDWAKVVTIKGLNSAVDTCSPTSFSCPQTGRPELDISYPALQTFDYTDAEGRTTRFTLSAGNVIGVRLPGSTSNDISVTYTSGRVTSITRFGVTTTYASSDSSGVRTVTVTRPGGSTRVVTFDIANSVMLSDRDELLRKTTYDYDPENRLTEITYPKTNKTQFIYDGRGNVTERHEIPKPGLGLPDIVTKAAYPTSCTNAVTCNRPTSTTDARNHTTNYTYDPTHGGVTSIKAPLPTSTSTVRPETRISYTRLNASGSPSSTGIFRATGTSTCQIGSAPSCVGTADEVETTIAYGQGLLPSSISKGAGNGSLTATQAMTYDIAGNLLTVDGPLSGTADTTRFRYNLDHELVGVVGPDPDGSTGALKNRAQRITYGTAGLVTKVELGTTSGQSDSAWAAFASSQEVQQTYDSHRRASIQKLVSGGTTYALTQNSYDNRGRLECTAVRMDSSQWNTQTDACDAQITGSEGSDRITKTWYNNANQIDHVQSGYDTTAVAQDVTYTYTENANIETVTDGEGNKTTYEYDSYDRLVKTRYPSPTTDGQSSNSDYEQFVLDANGNVTERRLRGYASDTSQKILYTYDNLDRLTHKNLPGTTEPDIDYTYDNLGRLTAAKQTAGTNDLAFTYDALSRNLTQDGPLDTVSYQYDIAGRRTRITWPDTFYVVYDHLVTGEVTKVRENGATSGVGVLATYAYDNLGRRASITRGNGVTTTYAWDPVSRLDSLTQALAGTSYDLTLGFDYNHAGQITTAERSNTAYSWTDATNGTESYTTNGLNQYTNVAGSALSYDERGNLTSVGGVTYAYTSENLLTSGSVSPGVTLSYDPLGRLYEVDGNTDRRHLYAGLDSVGEYNSSGTLTERYVFGPGADEPIVWYHGSGTTDRRWLIADERGSIIAATGSTGSPISNGIQTYDEYGQPGSGQVGRFGYTGQAWVPDLGISYYKARMYSPGLGRFMQTDPIEYGGGMNLYNYVGSDPLNFIDPLGLLYQATFADGTTCNFNVENGKVVDLNCWGGGGGGGGGYGDAINGYIDQNGVPPGDILVEAPRNAPLDPGIASWRPDPAFAEDETAQNKSEGIAIAAAKKIGRCAAEHYGLGALGAGLTAAGQPIPGTKPFVTPGSSRGTSLAGMGADAIFGKARLPFRLPTIVGGPGTRRALAIAGTKSVARFAGRAVPILGEALLAYDALSIAACALDD